MKVAQLQQIRATACELMRELGMVLHHCEEARTDSRERWDSQLAADLNQAHDDAMMVVEHATRLSLLVDRLALDATKKTAAAALKKARTS